MLTQVKEDKATITNLAKQTTTNKIIVNDLYNKIEKQSLSVRSDKAETTQIRTQVLAAQENIEKIATTITEEITQFLDIKTEANTCLKDQLEAISVDIGQVEAHLKTTQKLFTEGAVIIAKLEDGKEQRNKIIRAIVLLKLTEQQIRAAKLRMKEYGNKVLTKITKSAAQVPTSTVAPLSKDINDIQQKLTKSKKFWTKAKTVIQTESTNQIKKIQT